MQVWTITENYVEVIIDGNMVRSNIEYIGNRKVCTIENKSFYVSRLH